MAGTDFKPGSLDLENAISVPEAISIPASLAEIAVCPAEELVDDEICLAIREDEIPETILRAVLGGMAEEENSLRILRQKRGKDGKDTSYISLKRGTLLKYMSETLLQRQALMGTTGELDFKGPKFKKIFDMFFTIISDTIDEVKIPTEFKEIFFHTLSKNLNGWEEKAEKAIKFMTPKLT
jgi:hypothetical protein